MREMSASECTSDSASRRGNVAEVHIAEVVIAYLSIASVLALPKGETYTS
jgi:hypothetical protein